MKTRVHEWEGKGLGRDGNGRKKIQDMSRSHTNRLQRKWSLHIYTQIVPINFEQIQSFYKYLFVSFRLKEMWAITISNYFYLNEMSIIQNISKLCFVVVISLNVTVFFLSDVSGKTTIQIKLLTVLPKLYETEFLYMSTMLSLQFSFTIMNFYHI